jgi:hypothetical protein
MDFQRFNRRLHLYLAMFLMPWFLMYGVSSFPFNHQKLAESIFHDGGPMWTTRFDRPCDIPVEGLPLEQIGARMVKDAGLNGTFGTYRNRPNEVNVYWHTFRHSIQLTYFTDQKRLLAQDRKFRWDHLLTGMHARGGYRQDDFLNDAWAVTVDVVSFGFIVWIASGLIMWWQLRSARGWGWLALLGGAGLFLLFLFGM